ncbi:carboxypeptidase-like regulatory domain-containing protein [Hymenobacter sp. CRA2]|uniref:carboxypeptidase-like regulatory domain-containing protein n=1 Tax=Hymenobacter sp. CRA2 TaxID=1955620 RepID=UPI00098FE1FA|nr:carboxypeptidase-like regulatory domain-containing protein [Hymenobacter sp. CRA2]OON70198.1 hypothetical protein B0919_05545 [Hymenobacter sp. CRA2]
MSDNYQPVLPDEQVDNDEASLDSGNKKLGLIAGAAVLLIGAAIAFVPAENRQRIANGQMPTFELTGASVVASRPTEEAAPAPEAAAADKAAKAPVAARPMMQPASARAAAPAAAAAEPVAMAEPAAASEEPTAPAAPAAEEAPRNVTLNGRVLDENGKPLAGATVFVKGTNKIASTDQNGNYSVEAPAGDNSLVYGYGGYQDQEVRTRGSQAGNVTLLPSDNGRRGRRR